VAREPGGAETPPGPLKIRGPALAPALEAAAEAAVPGTPRSPGSPIRPGRSASPEEPEVAVAAVLAAAVAVAERHEHRTCTKRPASSGGHTSGNR